MITTQPITPVFIDDIPATLEPSKLYISATEKVAKHICLCGCGNVVTASLAHKKRQTWRIVREGNGLVSLVGGMSNYSPSCKIHYLITQNEAEIL